MTEIPTDLAYLIIRDGTKWSDIFRLIPGRTVTLGRGTTNQIVIKDERASRQHAEVFASERGWMLRDLSSRNGTRIGESLIDGDVILTPGDIIRIAQYELSFVDNLEQGMARNRDDIPHNQSDNSAEAITDDSSESHVWDDSPEIETDESPVITHRRDRTRFLSSSDEEAPSFGMSEAATKLCRIAFELAQQMNSLAVAQRALEGLFEGTQIDGGGVWFLQPTAKSPGRFADLELAAMRSEDRPRYHKVTEFLADTVLKDGEAVLARNIFEDSALGSRDSKGMIYSQSVICAPVRHADRILGLIHTYATKDDHQPTVEDLEFTLAVADNVALAVNNLNRQRVLTDNLSQTKREILQLRERLGIESELVGQSQSLSQIQQKIARAADSRTTVLIRGESGTGKELVARAIHFSGPRKKGPFVCLNCAALTETLLESELFGHERGAFTGATERKIGKFEASHQGTLLLDEIGEMSPSIQAKFLRVLEGHAFERVGGTDQIKADVRVIAATNRDLEKAVQEGQFRRDLYFRLKVLEFDVPPLRKRPDDIRVLAEYFLDRYNSETGRRLQGFTQTATAQLQRYHWPGNVRELKNTIERAVVLCQGEIIDVEDLALSNLSTSSDSSADYQSPRMSFEPLSLEDIEHRHVAATLDATDWNKSRTAAILGIERSTLDRKIKKYNIHKLKS